MKTLQNNFTTPEQSKRLLELGVPADSADCFYNYCGKTNTGRDLGYFKTPNILLLGGRKFTSWCNTYPVDRKPIPCWSVGRLIDIYNLCINCMPGMDLRLDGNDYVEEIIAAFELACDDSLEDFSELED